jgi:hypothetical protein
MLNKCLLKIHFKARMETLASPHQTVEQPNLRDSSSAKLFGNSQWKDSPGRSQHPSERRSLLPFDDYFADTMCMTECLAGNENSVVVEEQKQQGKRPEKRHVQLSEKQGLVGFCEKSPASA